MQVWQPLELHVLHLSPYALIQVLQIPESEKLPVPHEEVQVLPWREKVSIHLVHVMVELLRAQASPKLFEGYSWSRNLSIFCKPHYRGTRSQDMSQYSSSCHYLEPFRLDKNRRFSYLLHKKRLKVIRMITAFNLAGFANKAGLGRILAKASRAYRNTSS
jgi:hypothetical protein